ncbi:hypothetical protein CKO25_18935 [Thiocapsa imhoffii]|uniref:Uncharacterized protein n=1 Tax=Thiocapsa imhoffii TaxID=382777 RepID=A0A9X0WLH9_9GAMM|nr:hypothetical protein [Thiocapsa imhoffii]
MSAGDSFPEKPAKNNRSGAELIRDEPIVVGVKGISPPATRSHCGYKRFSIRCERAKIHCSVSYSYLTRDTRAELKIIGTWSSERYRMNFNTGIKCHGEHGTAVETT